MGGGGGENEVKHMLQYFFSYSQMHEKEINILTVGICRLLFFFIIFMQVLLLFLMQLYNFWCLKQTQDILVQGKRKAKIIFKILKLDSFVICCEMLALFNVKRNFIFVLDLN